MGFAALRWGRATSNKGVRRTAYAEQSEYPSGPSGSLDHPVCYSYTMLYFRKQKHKCRKFSGFGIRINFGCTCCLQLYNMPYVLVKSRKYPGMGYVKNKLTGKKYSKEPIPLERAKRQLRALQTSYERTRR